jgi:hypothetical protein
MASFEESRHCPIIPRRASKGKLSWSLRQGLMPNGTGRDFNNGEQ